MGESNTDGVVINEDCSPQAQQHNASPGQASCSYGGNEEEEMVEGETTRENGFEKRSRRNDMSQNRDLLSQQVGDLTIQMTYLSHQVTLLLNALHVPSCQCGICKPYYQTQVEMFKMLKDDVSQSSSSSSSLSSAPKITDYNKPINATAQNGFIEKRQIKAKVPAAASMGAVAAPNSVPSMPNVPSMNDCEALLSQIFTQTGLHLNGAAHAAAAAAAVAAGLPSAFGLPAPPSFAKPFRVNPTTSTHQSASTGGRRSKYCSPEEKKAVAEYAESHGPSAAARKFGIPTPVAAYYHRKEYKPKLSTVTLASQMLPPVCAASPSATSGDDMDSTNGDCQAGVNLSPGKFVTASGAPKEQQPKSNPAHSTGSPGFLRGRGRGRPKLIGDELDAELVDYMVQVKQSNPRGHLTASQALVIARDYIMEKAPGLLEEHGGQIKLKLTWAMKLVTRISERQKEIELGLPAGTISNMTRTMSNTTVPGGNFMADMVAQNLLTQQVTQILNQSVSGNHLYDQMKQSMSQKFPVSTAAAASATPQILNVRELELPKPDDGDLKGEIVEASENDTKGEDMDVTEQQFDIDIENRGAGDAANLTARNNTSTVQQHFLRTNAF